MNRVLKIAFRGTAIFGLLLLAPEIATAQNPDSSEINNLLKEVKTHAVLAADDASTLRCYTLSKLDPQSHANKLNEISAHTSDLVEDFNKLGALRSSGSPWQQEAIDQIQPLVQSIADQLTATINLVKEHRSQVVMPTYVQYVKANENMMTKTARLISDFVDYGETKAQADALQRAHQLPVTARENP